MFTKDFYILLLLLTTSVCVRHNPQLIPENKKDTGSDFGPGMSGPGCQRSEWVGDMPRLKWLTTSYGGQGSGLKPKVGYWSSGWIERNWAIGSESKTWVTGPGVWEEGMPCGSCGQEGGAHVELWAVRQVPWLIWGAATLIQILVHEVKGVTIQGWLTSFLPCLRLCSFFHNYSNFLK